MTEATPVSATPRRTSVQAAGLAQTLWAALRALLLLRPEPRLRLRPAVQFWWLSLLTVCLSMLIQWLETSSPRLFNPDGVDSDATTTLLLLGLSTAFCSQCSVHVRSWTLAVLLAATIFWLALFVPGLQWLSSRLEWPDSWLLWLLGCWWCAAALRIGSQVLHDQLWPVRLFASLLLAGGLLLNWIWLEQERYFYNTPSAITEDVDSGEQPELPQIEGSAEQVMYAQPELLRQALSRIRKGRAEQPELFVLAFGGDGNERVFRNEVEYIERLFSARFGASQRVLKLINSPATARLVPLATLSNLRRALRGLREKMDSDDLLFLYLTSHGSPDHELFVNLLPLSLDQITPEDLADALREAEIGPRVVLISACYSGGFMTALRDPRALVITAARSDRPSFGCGAESQITYFGRAFLVDALNQQRDFVAAFKLARRLVTQREREQDEDPSEPQIEVGSAVQPALERWVQTLPEPGPEIAFEPTED